jgi:hypothetical protein
MPAFYSQAMTENERQSPPAFTLAMFLRSLLFGGVMGLTLLLLNAPLWAFYPAQISMAPWIFWELLHLDSKEERKHEGHATGASRQRGTSRSVA